MELIRLYLFITAQIAQMVQPIQMGSKGPGNLGNLESNKDIQSQHHLNYLRGVRSSVG